MRTDREHALLEVGVGVERVKPKEGECREEIFNLVLSRSRHVSAKRSTRRVVLSDGDGEGFSVEACEQRDQACIRML
eukprot:3844925-Rhodomonas_salina.4